MVRQQILFSSDLYSSYLSISAGIAPVSFYFSSFKGSAFYALLEYLNSPFVLENGIIKKLIQQNPT